MDAHFMHEPDIVPYTATATIAGGTIIQVDNQAGVVMEDLTTGQVGAVRKRGIFEVTAKASEAIAKGDAVYWDSVNNYAVKAATGGTFFLGRATRAQDSTNDIVEVELNSLDDFKFADLSTLPTSDPSVAGRAWNNTNVLNISAG